ncbi:MAG: ATP-binding protein [Lachnospiraceae bacterium]|nr:ATP-binding protein [Lachnospiraceae bacterium]
MAYKKRIADKQLEDKLDTFGATLIVGPKGCGKTTTAKMKAKSFIELQDEDKRKGYLSVANTQPSKLLIGENPRLIDEWQDAPEIWGAVRKSVDDRQEAGLYILTGSTSKTVDTPHTGTLRISTLKMYPMSLYESEESNGTVSIMELFDNPDSFDGCQSDLSLDDLIFAICRGGWPLKFISKKKENTLNIARDLFHQTCHVDISAVDDINRNPSWTETILKSYARNICTLASYETILTDVSATYEIGKTTLLDYISALEKLYIIEDVDAWCPSIRSKTAIRSSKKRNLIDPSIAVAALGIKPEYFNTDFRTLGFLFESLCIRDLKAYSSAQYGRISYYHDRYGLESDIVLHLSDGRYALIEVKLGYDEVDKGAEHLVKIEKLIKEYNEEEKQVPLRLPDLKIVLTGTEYGYKRDDGVFVIPIGCLRD